LRGMDCAVAFGVDNKPSKNRLGSNPRNFTIVVSLVCINDLEIDRTSIQTGE
jgi:hypothetical protein